MEVVAVCWCVSGSPKKQPKKAIPEAVQEEQEEEQEQEQEQEKEEEQDVVNNDDMPPPGGGTNDDEVNDDDIAQVLRTVLCWILSEISNGTKHQCIRARDHNVNTVWNTLVP